jgi:hypothetical protein
MLLELGCYSQEMGVAVSNLPALDRGVVFSAAIVCSYGMVSETAFDQRVKLQDAVVENRYLTRLTLPRCRRFDAEGTTDRAACLDISIGRSRKARFDAGARSLRWKGWRPTKHGQVDLPAFFGLKKICHHSAAHWTL